MQLLDVLLIVGGIAITLIVFIILLILFFRNDSVPRYEITCYVADKGSGKTTLACALANYFHRKYEPIVRQDLEPLIETAKNNGFPFISLPKDCLIYADTDVYVCKDDKHRDEFVKCYDCDINKFRIPTDNNYKLIDYYPFGSYLIFDEIANKAMARDFANFSHNLAGLLNLTRKFRYNISFIWPDYMGTDKIIRNSCHIIRYVLGSEIEYDKKGNSVKMKWWFVDYAGVDRVENFQKKVIPAGSFKPFKMFISNKKPVTKWYFEYSGDIGNLCKTTREELYLLHHFTRWTTRKQKNYDVSRRDVREFVKQNPPFSDNLADVVDNRSIAEKRKGIYKNNKEIVNED